MRRKFETLGMLNIIIADLMMDLYMIFSLAVLIDFPSNRIINPLKHMVCLLCQGHGYNAFDLLYYVLRAFVGSNGCCNGEAASLVTDYKNPSIDAHLLHSE